MVKVYEDVKKVGYKDDQIRQGTRSPSLGAAKFLRPFAKVSE